MAIKTLTYSARERGLCQFKDTAGALYKTVSRILIKLNALSNSSRMAPQGMLGDNVMQIKLTLSFNACLNGDINM